MKKIYICGPMTGYEDFNRDAFFNAAAKISQSCNIPMNPAMLPDGLTQAEYMAIDLAMLQVCDVLWALPGWRESKGALAEIAIAEKLGLTIVYF